MKRQEVLIASGAIINETAGKLRDKFMWPDYRIEKFVRATSRLAELHKTKKKISLVSDEADKRILEYAIAGNANLIISGDKYLLKLKSCKTFRFRNRSTVHTSLRRKNNRTGVAIDSFLYQKHSFYLV